MEIWTYQRGHKPEVMPKDYELSRNLRQPLTAGTETLSHFGH
jgi:hypothetical protein